MTNEMLLQSPWKVMFHAILYHIEKQVLETWGDKSHCLAITEAIPAPDTPFFFLRGGKLLNGNSRIEGSSGYFSQNSEAVRNSHSVSRKKITDNPRLPDIQVLRQTREDMEKIFRAKKASGLDKE